MNVPLVWLKSGQVNAFGQINPSLSPDAESATESQWPRLRSVLKATMLCRLYTRYGHGSVLRYSQSQIVVSVKGRAGMVGQTLL